MMVKRIVLALSVCLLASGARAAFVNLVQYPGTTAEFRINGTLIDLSNPTNPGGIFGPGVWSRGLSGQGPNFDNELEVTLLFPHALTVEEVELLARTTQEIRGQTNLGARTLTQISLLLDGGVWQPVYFLKPYEHNLVGGSHSFEYNYDVFLDDEVNVFAAYGLRAVVGSFGYSNSPVGEPALAIAAVFEELEVRGTPESSSVAVPEPSSVVLGLIALPLFVWTTHRGRRIRGDS